MVRRGLRLSLLGLILGLLVGLAIVVAQKYAAKALIDLLQDEINISTGCDFDIKHLEISLITLSAVGNQARMVCKDKEPIKFKFLYASFSLSKIREHLILLDNLVLQDGEIYGADPSSETFRFVDYLVAPIPPERDYPGRWKLNLLRLKIEHVKLSQPLGSNLLLAENGNLLIERQPDTNFLLTPYIEKVTFIRNPSPKYGARPDISLGKIEGSLVIEDNIIDYKKIALLFNNNNAVINGVSYTEENDRIDATLKLYCDKDTPYLQKHLGVALQGDGHIEGTLGKPVIKGKIAMIDGQNYHAPFSSIVIPPLQSLDSNYTISLSGQGVDIESHTLSGKGGGISLDGSNLSISKDYIVGGKAKFKIDSVETAVAKLHGVETELDFSGTFDDPVLTFKGKIANTTKGIVKLPEIKFEAILKELFNLDFKISHESQNFGKFYGSGSVEDFFGVSRLSNNTSLIVEEVRPVLTITDQITEATTLPTLKGEMKLFGEMSLDGLEGSGNFTLYHPTQRIFNDVRGKISLLQSDLKIEAANLNGGLTFKNDSSLSDRKISEFTFKIDTDHTSNADSNAKCINLNISGDYRYRTEDLSRGNGSLLISEAILGCGPYTLQNITSAQYPIKEGLLDLNGLSLSGSNSQITTRGKIGFNQASSLNLYGSLDMKALLGIFPSFDDLRGTLSGKLNIIGELNDLHLDGQARLEGCEFDIESAAISGRSISGNFAFHEHTVTFEDIKGDVNDGSFTLQGNLAPLELSKSRLELALKDILIAPLEDASLIFSGNLLLSQSESGQPALKGVIELDSGEYRRRLDLRTFLKALPNYIFTQTKAKANIKSLPEIDLDLKLVASRNIFVLTNWLNAELSSNLSLTGNLRNPLLNGTIDSVSGWLGIKDRNFEISSARIEFKPSLAEPVITLLAEARVQSRTGDNIFVVLEANGPISSPKVLLSSDQALSQREILSLVTSGSSLSRDTIANSLKAGFDYNNSDSIEEDSSLLGLPSLVRNLTSIDSLNIEPTYNFRTGTIDPSIVARKRLFERLYLEGESFFGSSETLSQAQVVYDLTDSFNLKGIIESRSTRKETALEGAATFTILSSQKRFLKLRIEGNDHVSKSKILKALRLSEDSRIACQESQKISSAIEKYYQSLGYPETKVKLDSTCDSRSMRELIVHISEGRPAYTESIVFEGDQILGVIDQASFTKIEPETLASETLLNRVKISVVKALRSEGYIKARVEARYQSIDNSEKRKLVITVLLGQPVSFIFRGNTQFSAEDFLETINLFERKLPLGNNTINVLVEGIERKYREAGYLYATIKWEQSEDPTSHRINYIISINEESFITVKEVIFDGNLSLSKNELAKLLKQEGLEDLEELFSPQIASAEDLAVYSEMIKKIYIDEGYQEVKVTYLIEPTEHDDQVIIRYQIVEGAPLKADWLQVEGYPSELLLPTPPKAPYSIITANRYVETIMSSLHDAGYFSPVISSSMDPNQQRMTLNIEAGQITKISYIEVEGLQKINRSVVDSNIRLQVGDAWRTQLIDQSKRQLVKIGLFSRIEFRPLDGELDSPEEVLLIRLDERALQTLEVGGGLNSTYGVHLFGEATDKGLFKDGKGLSLISDIYYDPREAGISEGVAGITYSHPNFNSSEYTLTEDLRYQKFDLSTQEFDLDRISLASYVYKEWSENLTFSFGHTIQQENLDNVSSDVILSPLDSGSLNLSFLSALLSIDQRDAPLNPTRGYAANLDYKIVSDAIGSDANFHALGGRYNWIKNLNPLSRRLSFAFSSRAASAWTFNGTPAIPISQRYYLGGRSSIRGFRENSLGPRGDQDSVLGGDLLVSNNFEFRYLLTDSTALHTFFDSGTVYLKDKHISAGDLRESVGIGIRYLSPIGPVGFDLGHPIDERSGEPSLRLHFNIGSSF